MVPGWVIVDGLPMYHRSCAVGVETQAPLVHVHGFGISGSYLEPTAARLAAKYPTYVPDLPGMGRSISPEHPLDLPGLVSPPRGGDGPVERTGGREEVRV